MSNSGQAFVKAFARSGQASRRASTNFNRQGEPATTPVTTPTPHVEASEPSSPSVVTALPTTHAALPTTHAALPTTHAALPTTHAAPASTIAAAEATIAVPSAPESLSVPQSDRVESTWLPNQGSRQTRIDTPQPATPATVGSADSETVELRSAQLDSTKLDSTPEPVIEKAKAASLIPFIANWEIDVFDVPQTVANLFFEDELFNAQSESILEARQAGLRSMLITSLLTGEGRSSVAIGIAMTAAASGLKVALVDANFSNPSLADDFRLDLDFGWIDHIRSRAPISETAVHAMEDNVTLFPLLSNQSTAPASASECAALIETLNAHFDLIIVDADTVGSLDTPTMANVIDSAVIVFDPNQSSDQAIKQAAANLKSQGITGIGTVENFA